MNPAAHYAEAERLIGLASNENATDIKNRLIATAQVHATLATVDTTTWHKDRPTRKAGRS